MIDSNSQPIIELVKETIEGKYQLPFFQRDYVWKLDVVNQFLLSFLNGEYLNSIIVTPFDVNKMKMRQLPFALHFNELYGIEHDHGTVNLVIDGQQRLATLSYMFLNDLLFFKGAQKGAASGLIVSELGRYVKNDIEKIRKDLSDVAKFSIHNYLWVIKYVEDGEGYEAQDVVQYNYTTLKRMKVDFSSYSKFVKSLLLALNDKNKNHDGEYFTPVFVFREFLGINSKILKDLNKELKSIRKELEKEEIIPELHDLYRKFSINNITHVKISSDNDPEKLAELYEKLNTVMVKLEYFDIIKASLATIKFEKGERGKFLNVEESINSKIKQKKLNVLENLELSKKFYEYTLRGMNFMMEMKSNEKDNIIGLSRGKGKNSLIKKLIRYFDTAEEFEAELENYLVYLNNIFKEFDKRTYLISFSNKDLIDGSLILFGAAAINAIKLLGDNDYDDLAKAYIIILIAGRNFFRHPDKAFLEKYKDVGKDGLKLSLKYIVGEIQYVEIIENLNEVLKDFGEILKRLNNEDFDEEAIKSNPLTNPNNYNILLSLITFYSKDKGYIKTLDSQEIKHIWEDTRPFKDIEIHHVFPRSKDAKHNILLNLVLLTEETNKRISDNSPDREVRGYKVNGKKIEFDGEAIESNLITSEKIYWSEKRKWEWFYTRGLKIKEILEKKIMNLKKD